MACSPYGCPTKGPEAGKYLHMGPAWCQHVNPPKGFNEEFDPKAAKRYATVTQSLQRDGWYETRTREDIKLEWASRYNSLKEARL